MNLHAAIELFLGNYRPSTRRSYMYVLRNFESYIGPARPLSDIQAVDIIRYSQYLSQRPEIKSPVSYNKYVKTLRTFFNWCISVQWISSSPVLAIKRQKTSNRIPRDKAFPDDALKQLLDYTRWKPREDAFVRFLADTGCRVGGAAALRVEDIYFENRKAFVIEKGKTEPRPVFFGDACAHALRRWILQQSRKRGTYVFSTDGHRMGNDHLAQFFRRTCERAGIGGYGPHSLRHRKGHQMADNKIAPSVAAQALGHEDVSVTLNYYYPRDWERVADVIHTLSETTENPPQIIRFEANKKRSG